MAKFNEIQVGRYNRFLAKLFSMKGGAVLDTLQPELVATFPFLNGVEHRYLEGWDRFAGGFVVAAVALNMSGIRFRNPAASNVIAVFERIEITEPALDSPRIRLAAQGVTADLGTLGNFTNNTLDVRSRPNATLVGSQQASAATVPTLNATFQFTIAQPSLLASTVYQYIQDDNQEIALLPGAGLQVEAGTVNTQLEGVFQWRERFLEESERT
jgi:hypothetical protein